MDAYIANIEEKTLDNSYFRKVLFTWPHLQLVVMTLQPWEDIWEEIHDREDQFIRVEQGRAKAIVDWEESELTDDMIIVIPAWAKHNIINLSSDEKLFLYTIYCEKHHPEGTIHETKADAIAAEENH
jgi:mannose-6-phosphate isomerase-like protein (cupin superfamily)